VLRDVIIRVVALLTCVADFWTNCSQLITFMKDRGAAASSSTAYSNRFCCSPLHPCALHPTGHSSIHDDKNRGASFPDALCSLFALTLNGVCSPQRFVPWKREQGVVVPAEAPLRVNGSDSSAAV
jgi:hypothetical protein